jgi:hypothetical protein
MSWADTSNDEHGFRVQWWTGSAWQLIGDFAAGTTGIYINGVTSGYT